MIATFPRMGWATYAFDTFLQTLGAEVLLPPPITRRTLELGTRYAPELVCLPFKVTLGNFIETLELGADTLFMAAGARRCRFGLYWLVQARILKDLGYRFRMYALNQHSLFELLFDFLPRTFGVSLDRVAQAVGLLLAKSRLIQELEDGVRALRTQDFSGARRFEAQLEEKLGRTHTLSEIEALRRRAKYLGWNDDGALKIGLVGEIYLLMEPSANQGLERELGRMGVRVYNQRSIYRYLRYLLKSDPNEISLRRRAHRYLRESPGGEAERTVGEAVKYAEEGMDGVIHVYPFTCMPENIALEALSIISQEYGIPLLSLSLDEHTSRTGLLTRLEAFVDLVERRRRRRAS
jgi:predicted nucleotide-binding protein (sugar kinase/HSP70/actin superfamily)